METYRCPICYAVKMVSFPVDKGLLIQFECGTEIFQITQKEKNLTKFGEACRKLKQHIKPTDLLV